MGWTVADVARGLSLTILTGTIALLAGCVSPELRSPERLSPERPPPDDPPPREQERDTEVTPPDDNVDRGDRAAEDLAPPEDPAPVEDPVVTQDLPRLPPRRVVPVPPDTATPEQLQRIREYYGIRSVPALSMDIAVEPIIDVPTTAVRYIRSGLEQGGVRPAAMVDSMAGEQRATLAITIAGDRLNSRQYHYARAVVRLRYRTGPGLRLTAETVIRGPYRLSQVSPADAVLRSLFVISGETYAATLADIDTTWSAGVDRTGLPYQVERLPDSERCVDGPFFEVPPLLQHQLMLWSRDSDCDYLVDPLTGIIKIVYNGTT